jgi:hypothetical protein
MFGAAHQDRTIHLDRSCDPATNQPSAGSRRIRHRVAIAPTEDLSFAQMPISSF